MIALDFLLVNKMETKVASIILGLQLCIMSFTTLVPDNLSFLNLYNILYTNKIWFLILLSAGGTLTVGALFNVETFRVVGLVLSQTIWFNLSGMFLFYNHIGPLSLLMMVSGFGCMWLLTLATASHVKDQLKLRRKSDIRTREEDS